MCVLTAPVFGMVRGCVVPCIRSMLSKAVNKDKQGGGKVMKCIPPVFI